MSEQSNLMQITSSRRPIHFGAKRSEGCGDTELNAHVIHVCVEFKFLTSISTIISNQLVKIVGLNHMFKSDQTEKVKGATWLGTQSDTDLDSGPSRK